MNGTGSTQPCEGELEPCLIWRNSGAHKGFKETPSALARAVSRQQSRSEPTGRCSPAQEESREAKGFRGQFRNISS